MCKVHISYKNFEKIQAFLQRGLKVYAIKQIQDAADLNLKEAKHLADRLWEGESMKRVFSHPFNFWSIFK